MTISIIAIFISIGTFVLSVSTAVLYINTLDEIIEVLKPYELSCETCKWCGNECENSEPYEGKSGYVVGDDWCEFYVRKKEKMNSPEKVAETTEIMGVLVKEMPEICWNCDGWENGFGGNYCRYAEYIGRLKDMYIRHEKCPLKKAIGIVRPDGTIEYFHCDDIPTIG